jgi:hypothetical protein
MSNTELATIPPPQPVTNPPAAPEDCGTTPTPTQDVESKSADVERVEQELAPMDGGQAAWMLLAAAFVFETLLWGE